MPRGATLIEVVVATLILAIVSLGLVEFFARGRFWFDQEERKRVATMLAQEAMERIEMPSAQIVPYDEERVIAAIRYRIVMRVEANSPELGVHTLRCTVTWNALPGVPRSVSLASMACDM